MRIDRLQAAHFRNFTAVDLPAHPQVNVIYGDNAQGKTNLLEALWLFTGGRSFRGAKEGELIQLGSPFARLSVDFFSAGRAQAAQLVLGQGKGARLNGVALPSAGRLTGHFFAVVFSPAHLSLVQGGPGERRRFLDGAISQLRPRFVAALGQYQRILAQRNTLLKAIQRHPPLAGTLPAWDEALARQGAVLLRTRQRYLALLEGHAAQIYRGISGGREGLSLRYSATVLEGEDPLAFAACLKAQQEEDVRLGFTQSGPHRDDLEMEIDGRPARLFASQGQQRSAVLALKLAECALLEQLAGEAPVVLLDDVMSELDLKRRDFLLNRMQGRQVFITCCDRETLSAARAGAAYYIEGGRLAGSQPLL